MKAPNIHFGIKLGQAANQDHRDFRDGRAHHFVKYSPQTVTFFESAVLRTVLHRPRLDRVQPSYRFKDWLEYPAMGLCGVLESSELELDPRKN